MFSRHYSGLARRIATGIATICVMVAITACSADPQVIHQRIYVKQEVPASLLTCAPWPQPDTLPQDVRGLVEWLARAKAAARKRLPCVRFP